MASEFYDARGVVDSTGRVFPSFSRDPRFVGSTDGPPRFRFAKVRVRRRRKGLNRARPIVSRFDSRETKRETKRNVSAVCRVALLELVFGQSYSTFTDRIVSARFGKNSFFVLYLHLIEHRRKFCDCRERGRKGE